MTSSNFRRTLALARGAFKVAIAEKPAGRFMIRSRIRVVKRPKQVYPACVLRFSR
jgi:hypothetical protein